MGSLFAKPAKKPPVTSKDKAILDLKITRDKLTKYQKQMDVESEKLKNQATSLLQAGNKNKALLLLKIRKYKTTELARIDGQLITVMKMIQDIEWESHNVEAMKALRAGTEELNRLHSEMSLEDVESILADSEEAIEMENEISRVISGQFSPADEEELQAELDALTALYAPTSAVEMKADLPVLPDAPRIPILPNAPTHTPQATKTDSERQATLA